MLGRKGCLERWVLMFWHFHRWRYLGQGRGAGGSALSRGWDSSSRQDSDGCLGQAHLLKNEAKIHLTLTSLQCAIQWYLVHSQCCKYFITSKGDPVSREGCPPSPAPLVPCQSLIYSLAMDLPILDISQKQNHIMTFCVSLLSLCMFSRFIHVEQCLCPSFLHG